nr:hypothetical protein [Actinomadura terrae]
MIEPVLRESFLREEVQVVGVVIEAAGVLQQLPNRDLAAAVAVALDDAGQPFADRVVQAEPSFTSELQDRGRDVGLGVAAPRK